MGRPGHKGSGLVGVFAGIRRWLAQLVEHRRTARRGAPRHSFGRRSERLAERHLRWRGYRILARNFRAAGAEIDLVALDGETLVFVEVKARRSTVAGAPAEAVDERKQRRLRRAAAIFTARRRADGRPMRFDVVAISGEGRSRTLEHLRNAF
jgi:putative endonuclease